jgi:hypothetical protein
MLSLQHGTRHFYVLHKECLQLQVGVEEGAQKLEAGQKTEASLLMKVAFPLSAVKFTSPCPRIEPEDSQLLSQ